MLLRFGGVVSAAVVAVALVAGPVAVSRTGKTPIVVPVCYGGEFGPDDSGKYFGEQGLTNSNLQFRLGEIVMELTDMLYEQVRCCLRYREQIPGATSQGEGCAECDAEAARIVSTFFDRIPHVRLGRYVRFDHDALLEWAGRRQRGPVGRRGQPISNGYREDGRDN